MLTYTYYAQNYSGIITSSLFVDFFHSSDSLNIFDSMYALIGSYVDEVWPLLNTKLNIIVYVEQIMPDDVFIWGSSML